MTTLREAAALALEALESIWSDGVEGISVSGHLNAIVVLRAVLDEPTCQVEPVAWRTFDGEGGYDYRTYDDNEDYAAEWAQRNPRHVGWVEALYLAPLQHKPLSEETIDQMFDQSGIADYGDHENRQRAEHLEIYSFGIRDAECAHGIGGEE